MALASLAALVPVAAAQDSGTTKAMEREPGLPDDGREVAAARASVQAAAPDRAKSAADRTARVTPRTGTVSWRDSVAHGVANAGWLEDGVQLPATGTGFYTYNPATQSPPGGAERRWGHDRLVREIVDLGRWWARRHPNGPRLGVGDLSRPSGGPFHGPVVGHVSHQNGLDVDIRLVRADGSEAQVGASDYDRERTQQIVDRLVERGAELVLVGPSLRLTGPPGVVVTWPNHDDHLHVRFPKPAAD